MDRIFVVDMANSYWYTIQYLTSSCGLNLWYSDKIFGMDIVTAQIFSRSTTYSYWYRHGTGFLLCIRGWWWYEDDNSAFVVYTAPIFLLVTRIQRGWWYEEDNTTFVVITAPRLFLVTQIHDNEDDDMRKIILHHSLCLRHQDSLSLHEYTRQRGW